MTTKSPRHGGRLSQSTRFRADIQGLRAIAIVSVVLYHSFGKTVPGGFVGVDVFFVISGFLITRILLAETAAGIFSLPAFYARRVRRLFPGLFTMLAAALVAGLLLLPPPQLAQLGESAAWTAFFAANLHQYRTVDYFATAAEYRPLVHAWSLGVEEQFYIGYPLFLATMSRLSRRWLKLALWLGVCISLAWSCRLLETTPKGAFYLPQSRAFELGLGALIAAGAIPRVPSQAVAQWLSLLGQAMLLSSFAVIEAATPYPGLVAVLPCGGTMLIIHAGDGRDLQATKVLNSAPLQFVGAISYSLYLWHWPVLVFARYVTLGALSEAGVASALVFSLGLAWLSYRFIERPAMRLPLRANSLLMAGAATVAVSLCGFALARLDGIPQRFGPRPLAMFAAAGDFNPRRATCHYQFDRPPDYARSCAFGARAASPSVAVWGDSFGAELAVGLGEIAARQGKAVRELTASSCPPSLSYNRWDRPGCAAYNRATLAALTGDANIRTIVLAADYDGYDQDRLVILQGLRQAALKLRVARKRIVLVYPVPRPTFDVPQALGMLAWQHRDSASWGPPPESVGPGTPTVRYLDALAGETGAAKLVPANAFCSGEHCETQGPAGAPLYFDDKHLSLAGARLLLSRQSPAWIFAE